MKYLLLILTTLTLIACGGGESGGGSDTSSKDLFSLWTSDAGEIDLTDKDFGVFDIRIRYAANAGCDCRLELIGDQQTGTARLFSCNHYGPVNYCSPGTVIYGYTNQDATLYLCIDDDCEAYQ